MKLSPMIPDNCARPGCAPANRGRGTDCALRFVRSGRFYPHPNSSAGKGIESGAPELPSRAPTNALVIITHRGEERFGGSLSSGVAAVSVLIEPGFAAFVAQQSADPPAACGDLVDQDALAGGLGLELFEQSVEDRIEFLGASGAVEFGVDDVAGEETVLERVEPHNGLALGRARAGGFHRVGTARRKPARRKRGQSVFGRVGRVWGILTVVHSGSRNMEGSARAG